MRSKYKDDISYCSTCRRHLVECRCTHHVVPDWDWIVTEHPHLPDREWLIYHSRLPDRYLAFEGKSRYTYSKKWVVGQKPSGKWFIVYSPCGPLHRIEYEHLAEAKMTCYRYEWYHLRWLDIVESGHIPAEGRPKSMARIGGSKQFYDGVYDGKTRRKRRYKVTYTVMMRELDRISRIIEYFKEDNSDKVVSEMIANKKRSDIRKKPAFPPIEAAARPKVKTEDCDYCDGMGYYNNIEGSRITCDKCEGV